MISIVTYGRCPLFETPTVTGGDHKAHQKPASRLCHKPLRELAMRAEGKLANRGFPRSAALGPP